MKYMTIGNSGIRASVISLGALSIGGGDWWKSTVDETSIQTVHKALDLGVNLIDTAPIYGIGHSEEIIGKALEGRRHEAVISTKATFDWDTGVGRYAYDVDGHKMYCDHSYAGIIKDCENSLRRLKTDYIDIYYTHNPARDETMYPVEETVRALMDLKKAGKIRVAIGPASLEYMHLPPPSFSNRTFCISCLSYGPFMTPLFVCRTLFATNPAVMVSDIESGFDGTDSGLEQGRSLCGSGGDRPVRIEAGSMEP